MKSYITKTSNKSNIIDTLYKIYQLSNINTIYLRTIENIINYNDINKLVGSFINIYVIHNVKFDSYLVIKINDNKLEIINGDKVTTIENNFGKLTKLFDELINNFDKNSKNNDDVINFLNSKELLQNLLFDYFKNKEQIVYELSKTTLYQSVKDFKVIGDDDDIIKIEITDTVGSPNAHYMCINFDTNKMTLVVTDKYTRTEVCTDIEFYSDDLFILTFLKKLGYDFE